MFLQENVDNFRVTLRFSNVVVFVKHGGNFFTAGTLGLIMGGSLAHIADPGLAAFYLGYLLNETFVICSSISRFRSAMLEFTLNKK